MRYLHYIFISIIFLACIDKKKENDSTTIVLIPMDSSTSSTKSDIDTITLDTLNIPSENSVYKAKILTTGFFHENEIQKGVENNDWYGIFKSKDSFYIEKTKLIVSRVYDRILEEDSTTSKTGWKIETFQKDTSILLVSGITTIKPRSINQTKTSKTSIQPGDSINVQFNSLTYTFYATGSLVNKKGHTSYYANYKLFISITQKSIKTTQLIVAKPYFENGDVKIVCIGDFDGDNMLDLVMDTSNFYNMMIPTLYLSCLAKYDEIIKVAGLHISVGC